MPAFEIGIQPGRHRQYPVEGGPILRPLPQPWGYDVAHDFAVEGVAGDGDAISAQNIPGGMPSAAHAGPHLHEREVARAPAEIGDQNELVMVELALELV